MPIPTEAESLGQPPPIPETAGSTDPVATAPWPGALNDKEGIWAMDAWLRALARGIGLTITRTADGLPPTRLAKALVAFVRKRRQFNLFREDDTLVERHLDDLVAKHAPKARATAVRADGDTPPIG